MGNTTAVHGLQDVTMRGLQRLGTETTISCSLASPAGGYNRGNDLSISLSLYTVTLYINIRNTTSTTHSHNNKVSLSHIYTNMTFGLFSHIAPGGSLEHIHIFVPSSRSGRLPPGLQSSGSRPIRRDLFPNKLPLHSGMGCHASPIRF